MFIQNEQYHGQMSLKERMINEVSKSVTTAYALCNILDKYHVEPRSACRYQYRSQL